MPHLYPESEAIFSFPLATKQGSISLAHRNSDIDLSLERTREVLAKM